VQVEGKKMSKSLGNFFTVRDLLDQGWPGEVIRFVMLSTHYRKPMDWTEEKAREAEKVLMRWRTIAEGVEPSDPEHVCVKALSEDLNTSLALSSLHALFRHAEKTGAGLNRFVASARLLGLLEPAAGNWGWKQIVRTEGAVQFVGSGDETHGTLAREIAKKWQDFRAMKDFVSADELKQNARSAGLELRVLSGAIQAEALENFDPTKLEALK